MKSQPVVKLSLITICMFLYQVDVKSKEIPEKLPSDNNQVVDIRTHIFGHKFGKSKDLFVKEEGEPDGFLKLGNNSIATIYGRTMAFIFTEDKLSGVLISPMILDMKLGLAMKSKSRFDQSYWTIKQGIKPGMTSEELTKKFGDKLQGGDYLKRMLLNDKKITITLAENRIDGRQTFTVSGIYLITKE